MTITDVYFESKALADATQWLDGLHFRTKIDPKSVQKNASRAIPMV